MIVFRRRLIFWLIKAYIKKAGKTIFLSFFLGLITFFLLVFASRYFAKYIPITKKVSIGISGAYTLDNLPPYIVKQISRGLTYVADDGSIKPDLASSWEVLKGGKVYIFHLRPNQYFSDRRKVTSDTINYDFSDVSIERPDKYTIVYKLKDAYAPFLITVSKPVLRGKFEGVGEYQIEDVKLNGNFIQSLTLSAVKNKFDTIHYLFYPSDEAVKMALLLGEVSNVKGLSSTILRQMTLSTFPNITITKQVNYSRLVTIFYNTSDSTLSDKKIRLGLSYALPNTFEEGQRNYLSYAPISIYFNKDLDGHKKDLDHAKLLLTSDDNQKPPSVKLTVLRKYLSLGNLIADSWKKAGVHTNIEEVDSVPSHFQIFLGDFNLPRDPDQYSLWHSNQLNNITRYKNLRIDKLLEDGRKTVNTQQRRSIYLDFQKYLQEDEPASFLYFPYEYEVVRK